MLSIENERRMAWQLGLLIVFWGMMSFTSVIQFRNLPPSDPNPTIAMWNEKFKPDPYTYYPLEYNPFNDRMTLIESMVIYVGLLYGIFRIFNIFRIMGEDEQENKWRCFWELCEQQTI